jgi:hypothetical protein
MIFASVSAWTTARTAEISLPSEGLTFVRGGRALVADVI